MRGMETLSTSQIQSLIEFATGDFDTGPDESPNCPRCTASGIGMCGILALLRINSNLIPKDPSILLRGIDECERIDLVEGIRGILAGN